MTVVVMRFTEQKYLTTGGINPMTTQTTSNVTALHPEQSEVQPPPMWPVITPHPDPVGTEVFRDIMTDLQRYLFIGKENALTVVL